MSYAFRAVLFVRRCISHAARALGLMRTLFGGLAARGKDTLPVPEATVVAAYDDAARPPEAADGGVDA